MNHIYNHKPLLAAAAELESIDKAITAVRAEMQGKLNALQERRDSLLAITHNKENEDE